MTIDWVPTNRFKYSFSHVGKSTTSMISQGARNDHNQGHVEVPVALGHICPFSFLGGLDFESTTY